MAAKEASTSIMNDEANLESVMFIPVKTVSWCPGAILNWKRRRIADEEG